MFSPRNRLIQLLGLSLMLVVLAACGSPDPTPTLPPPPTTVPTAEPPATAEPTLPPEEEATDDSWETIQSAGVIRVGTSADYAPFSYYNSSFAIDGFDPALMRAIGEELGVDVVMVDYAFDGLYDELELGQIDAIISAVSITPSRQEVVNFSNVYYVGRDAFVASNSSNIEQVTSLSDLSTSRIGVQSGSVYESWVTESLIETGLMSPALLSSYSDIDQALGALEAGLVDVVIMDALPAEAAVQERDLKIVGEGLNRQLFAIVLPQGADTLTTQINTAMATLNQQGIIAEIGQEYLDLDNVELPDETPEPEDPDDGDETPPEECVDSMSYVADLTYDDQNMTNPPILSPGQPFTKGWRVMNSGTCTWGPGYRLAYVQGNSPYARMGGEPVNVNRDVPPGGTYDFQANLIAPLVPGTYQGFWQMVDATNVPFGQRIWVGITVPAPATPTPMPTQTPTTDITFTANPTSVRAGERVVFSWDVRNAKAVYFYEQGQDWRNHGVVGQASAERYPQHTTIYELRVVRLDDSVDIRQIRIDVTPVENAPAIDRFSVEPRHNVLVGQCVTVSWAVSGNVSNVRIQVNDEVLRDNAPVGGNVGHCPSLPGSYDYKIEATGPGGTNRSNIAIVVNDAATPPPTATPPPPTPAPQPPIINYFSVEPNEIAVGECVTIKWEASGGADKIQLKRNGVIVLDNAPLKQTTQDCPSDSTQVTYRLEVSNSEGLMVTREENVTVSVSAVPLPATTDN